VSDRDTIADGVETAIARAAESAHLGLERYGQREKLSPLERRVLLAQVAGAIMGGAVAGRYQESEVNGWSGRILAQTMEIAEHVLVASGIK
jgi:hypothetical protein